MTDTIFLVHGMGHHPDNWHSSVETTLKNAYQKYNLSRRPFETRFKVKPISYDAVFRRLVERWQEDATALGAVADAVGANEVSDLVGWLRNAGDTEDNPIWTHAADVLLYRLFYTVRHEIKSHIAHVIATEIDTLTATERWSIIAHSLGTAVAHDSLDMLWTGKQEDGSPTGFEPMHDQALVVAMVANVSRILQTVPKAYEGTVKPGRSGQNGRGCLSYMTFRHILDPFCIPKMFRPDNWPESAAIERGIYRYVEIEHIHDINIHGFSHYLKNPKVHIPIFRGLAGFRTAVTAAEEEDELSKFKKFGNLTQGTGIKLKEKLEEIAPGISADWKAYRNIWDEFFGLFD